MKRNIQIIAAAVLCFISSLHAQVKTVWKNSYSDKFSVVNLVKGRQQHLVDPQGNMYIAGQTDMDTSSDSYGLLLKYNQAGKLSLNKILTQPNNQTQVPTNVEGCSIISSDDSGRIYVYGSYYNMGGSMATETFVCNDSGKLQKWDLGFGSTEEFQAINDKGQLIQAEENGNAGEIYVFNDIFYRRNQYQVARWDTYFGHGLAQLQFAGAILDKIDNLYITAYAYYNDSSSYDLLLAKVDSAGSLKWVKAYNYYTGSNRATLPTGIALDDSGNVYLSAYATDIYDNSKGLLLKYAPDGSRAYVREIMKDSLYTDMRANDIRTDSKGNLVLTGYAVADNLKNQMLVKYSPAGNLVWGRLFSKNDGSDIVGDMLTIDSAGNPIILSEKDKSSSSDALVAKYNSNGQLLWSQTVDIEKYDVPQQITVVGNGDIYFSGNSFVTDTTANIISAKLSQSLKAGFVYQKYCAGNVTFGDASNSPSGTMTYNWDFGDGKSSSDQNPTHEYSSGTYIVKLTVSSRGSSDTYSDSITIDPLPQACFTVKSNGRKHTFTAIDATLADYTWIINNKDTLKGSSVTYLAASISETVSVKLIVVNQHGCQNSCSQILDGIQPSVAPGSVTIYPNPMNGSSVLSFTLLSSAVVSVRATDELGRIYLIQNDQHFSAGTILIPVNIPDASGLINYSLIIDGISQAQIKALKL
jgi:PKD repeat protein